MKKNPARAAALLLAGLLLAVPATAQNAPSAPAPPDPKARIAETSGIITQGYGEVRLKPELAYVILEARAQAPTLVRAVTESRSLAGRIVESVKRSGVAAADISVNSASNSGGGFRGGLGGGGFSNQSGGSVNGGLAAGENGQTVSAGSVINVTVRDLSRLGRVLAAAAGGGATGQAGVQYALSDWKTGRNAALKTAVQDAMSKAVAMAEAANLGDLSLAALTEGFAPSPYGGFESVDLGQPTEALVAGYSGDANRADASDTLTAPSPGITPIQASTVPSRVLVATATVTARFVRDGPGLPSLPRVTPGGPGPRPGPQPSVGFGR